jgi:hypothetical protein
MMLLCFRHHIHIQQGKKLSKEWKLKDLENHVELATFNKLNMLDNWPIYIYLFTSFYCVKISSHDHS